MYNDRAFPFPAKGKQFWILVFLGAVFWLLAALLIRFLGEAVLLQNVWLSLAAFAAALPAAVGFLWAARAVIGFGNEHALAAMAIMTGVATLLDGAALTFFWRLYGETIEAAHFGGALILWGAGVGLMLGYFVSYAAHKAPDGQDAARN